MNPNLNYALTWPGRFDSVPWGIIMLADVEFLDSIHAVEKSQHFLFKDKTSLRAWFSNMLNWLLESKNGKEEAKAENNHGSWYDAIVTVKADHGDWKISGLDLLEEQRIDPAAPTATAER